MRNGSVERSIVSGRSGILGGESVTVIRSRVEGTVEGITHDGTGFFAPGPFQVSRSLVRAPVGIDAADGGITGSTVVGTGAATTGVSTRYKAPLQDDLRVRSTVIEGFDIHLERIGEVAGFADLDVSHSVFDPARVTEAGPGTATLADNVSGSPGFRGAADFRPRFDSALVDAGAPPGPGDDTGPDLAGLPGVRDGDGDGAARRDIGAFEYQRLAPTLTLSVPPTAIAGVPVTLGATASDGDAEALGTISWSFDDGTTATGATVTKTFAPGTRGIAAVVTDEAGVSTTRTASVVVVAPVGPAVLPPVGPVAQPALPPADTGPQAPGPARTALFAAVKGGTLRLDSKRRVGLRVSRPKAAERSCKGRAELRTAKKVKLSKKQKKARRVVFGRASYTVAAGKTKTVRVTLSKRHASFVRARKKIGVRAVLRGDDTAGEPRTISAKATLHPPKAKKKR